MNGLNWHQQRAMGMHAMPDDLVGYTYQADNYCPECILTVLVGTYNQITSSEVEADLDSIASTHSIDRQDEASYDSGEFPKVLFRDMLTSPDVRIDPDDCDHEGSDLCSKCCDCADCEADRQSNVDRCGRCHRVLGE